MIVTQPGPLTAVPAGGSPPKRKTGRLAAARRRVDWMPYWLILPATVSLVVVLGYPIVRLVELSFQSYGLTQLFDHTTVWDGVTNYRVILSSGSFWSSVLRTFVFTASCVGLTMVLGMAFAHLFIRLGKRMRTLLSSGMILVWAMPPITAVLVWQWLFANQFGVVDWMLTKVGLTSFANTDWFAQSPFSAFAIITLMIVWQAVPFVALSLYAGLVQIPGELYEAARVDGAGGWRTYRTITLPLLKPIVLLLLILSVIWDFNVFTQIWALTGGGPNGGTQTVGVWSYVEAFVGQSYGLGAAASVVTVFIVAAISFYYVKHLVSTSEVR